MISRDYPYMYARVSAKKAKLLEESDYQQLIKMEPNEIARKLQEGGYKTDIDELGVEYDGVELVELALMRNVSRTMADMIDISPDSLDPVINSFLRRYDILSLKRLLRWKKGGEKGEVKDLLVPVGQYTAEDLQELSEKSFEEICRSIKFKDSDVDYQSFIENTDDIREVERNLDRAYYKEMRQTADSLGNMWFKKFIRKEVEYEDLKIALRLKKYGLEIEEIEEWLVGEKITKCIEKVLESENLDEAIKEVEECEGLEFQNGKNIEDVEHTLEIERLKSAFRTLHTEPLGLTSVFGYIVAKMVEVKNLRMLIRAKETNIQNQETIRRNLVIA
ncbi:MAG: V/A-type H+-transporting ATPase subunit C [Candidatus Nanohaloarchaea archaeon]|jgi:V/A-type H+-transporting ATPase subunit C